MLFLKNFTPFFFRRHCEEQSDAAIHPAAWIASALPRNDGKLFAIVLFLFLLPALPAYAVCTGPDGDHGDMLYNLDHTVMQYCNGTKWISMDASKSGGSDNLGNHTATKDLDMTAHKIVNAAIPTSSADVTNKAYVDAAVASAAGSGSRETPNGRYAISCGMYSSSFVCARLDTLTGEATCRYGVYNSTGTWSDCPPSGGLFSGVSGGGSGMDPDGITQGGYFVMTGQTYNGNLGGLTGANAKCLTELQTHPWKGKGGAGTLTASRVKAFLCDGTTCNNLQPYTRYLFARARQVSLGGASMVTDASGRGPNDNMTWSGNVYFGSSTYWWSNRESTGDTIWSTIRNSTGPHCTNWTSAASNILGAEGGTSFGSYRWKYYDYSSSYSQTCNGSLYLICFVNPAAE